MQTDYPTKPLECWGRMKEIRRQHMKELWQAKERGGVVAIGTAEVFQSLPAGLGEFAGFGFGPNFGAIMDDRDLAVRCLEATEARGFGRDFCGICRINLGSMFLGIQLRSRSGETLKPDFCYQVHACEPLGKTGQIMSEYYGVPYFVLEVPPIDNEDAMDFLIAQLLDAIEWMERVTGRKYDDERLREAALNEWHSMVLWAKICERQKNVPAPLDLRHLASLSILMWNMKHKRETVEFCRLLLAEVEDRVRNGISARGFERKRLFHAGGWPWFYARILRLPEAYGAVFIGTHTSFGAWGAWEVTEEGSWRPARTPEERGLSLRTREEILRCLAELYMVYSGILRTFTLTNRVEEILRMVRDWRTDGVVFNFDYSCKGMTAGLTEAKLAMQREGIPTTHYELPQTDPRDLDVRQVEDRLECFLESLGLTRLDR